MIILPLFLFFRKSSATKALNYKGNTYFLKPYMIRKNSFSKQFTDIGFYCA